MPDLQTALSSVAKQINFDDDLEITQTPIEPSVNQSRKIFYWFVANPASTAREAIEAMGITANGSASGRIHQLWSKGLLSRVEGIGGFRYSATRTEYPTYTMEQRQALMQKAIAAKKAARANAKKHKKVKATNVVTLPPKATPSMNANPNAEQIVNSMSVGLAKAVYLELKKVFEA